MFWELGAGPDLVTLHAIGLTGRSWGRVASLLCDRYRVVAPDLPGHGGSESMAREFVIGGIADDVAELIRQGCDPPVAIVGLSMGGMVALSVALRHPALVSRLVLANTVALLPPALRAALKDRAERALDGGMAAVVDETISRWFTPHFAVVSPDIVDDVRSELLQADAVDHARSWLAISRLDIGDELASLAPPVLVVSSSDDGSTTPEMARQLAAAIPHARQECLAGVGHMSAIEEPRRFADLVDGFLTTS